MFEGTFSRDAVYHDILPGMDDNLKLDMRLDLI